MRIISRLAVLALIISCQLSAQEKRLTIAVNELQGEGIESAAARIITDRFRTELFNTQSFIVLERGQMENVLKEQGFQQSGCTSDECVVEVGQLLGVTHMIAGTIGKLGKTYTINVRMIDIATGQIAYTANADCMCQIDDLLSQSTVTLAKKLASKFKKPSKSAAPSVPKPPPQVKKGKKAKFGTLVIVTDPSGAKVIIDGKALGKTPFTAKKATLGKHKLKIKKVNYKPITEKLAITSGDIVTKNYKLEFTKVYLDSVEQAKAEKMTAEANKRKDAEAKDREAAEAKTREEALKKELEAAKAVSPETRPEKNERRVKVVICSYFGLIFDMSTFYNRQEIVIGDYDAISKTFNNPDTIANEIELDLGSINLMGMQVGVAFGRHEIAMGGGII